MENKGSWFSLILFLASSGAAGLAAFSMVERVELLEVLIIFFGGIGTGAAIASYLLERRLDK